MEILQDAGTYEILTPPEMLQFFVRAIEAAGRTCYQSFRGPITDESAVKFCKMIVGRKHESVIEHSIITVRFSNISRGFTHEMVRHRLCAFSQESTRYVDYVKGDDKENLDKFQVHCVLPPHKSRDTPIRVDSPHLKCDFVSPEQMFEVIESFYRGLRKSDPMWLAEDARQFLPIGLRSEIVVSANFREWRHIFSMRTTRHAHWEIRRVMCNLMEEVKGTVPILFDDFVEDGKDMNGLRYFKQLD